MRAKPMEPERGPPLDLVHLARQCQCDAGLQDELLRQFRLQSRALWSQLSEPPARTLAEKARIAHTLCGSALAVGAGRVAEAARRLENEIRAALEEAPTKARRLRRALAALDASVSEAIAEIERIQVI